MEATINEVSPVEYELEIIASSDELEPRLNKELKAQRPNVNMRGFRPGKVPISLVRKLYGRAVALEVAEKFMMEVFGEKVEGSDEYDLFGRPEATELEFEPGTDFRAVIRFGVKPTIELKDLSGEELFRLSHEVTDDDVEQEIENVRRRRAEQIVVDDPADEQSYLTIDLQRIDEDSGAPIIGEKQAGAEVHLDDESLLPELKNELIGKKAGDVFRVDLPAKTVGTEEERASAGTNRYEVTVNEVRVEELPELTDAFAAEVTEQRVTTVEQLRKDVRRELESHWQRRSRELLEEDLTDRVVETHRVPIPESAIQLYLDSFVEDFKKRYEDKIPPDFDVKAYREKNRGEAEKLARWVLIKEALVEKHVLEVTEEDRDRFYERTSEDTELDAADLKRFYSGMPEAETRLDHRLLTDKIIDTLIEEVNVKDLDREAYFEQRREAHQRRSELSAAGG